MNHSDFFIRTESSDFGPLLVARRKSDDLHLASMNAPRTKRDLPSATRQLEQMVASIPRAVPATPADAIEDQRRSFGYQGR